jgi:toxin FitB
MVILDTNVVSELMHEPPDPAVVAWLNGQARVSVWTTAICVMEIRYGIATLSPGRRQSRLLQAMERLVAEKIEHRVAAFDSAAALSTAMLTAERHRTGRTGDLRDAMIAGIAIANMGTLATRNIRHFDDLSVPVVDPWSA